MSVEELIDNATDEELDAIIAKVHMLTDYPTYAESVLKIQTIQAKIIPFTLNSPQRLFHKIIEEYIAPNRLVRVVTLKARRMGISTYLSGRYYRGTSCNNNKYAIQITHEPDATDFLFKMVKRFHNLSPPDFKPETLYNNARLMEFNNKAGTGLNSAFRVATAGKDDVGSGQLLHYVHLSEVAKYQKTQTEELLTSILQCVPDEVGTEFFMESTAKGIGGEFYSRFWGARYRIWISKLNKRGNPVITEEINEQASEEDVFTSVFLPWFCFDIYQMDVPAKFKITDDEKELKATYGVTNKQLAWRRWVIANKCNNDVETFQQEYPANPKEAFLGTGRPVFKDSAYLMRCSEAAALPVNRYELHAANWVTNTSGRLRVWEEPVFGDSYIISADVAEGLTKGDFSSADVINHRTGRQVAQWHGHVDSDNIIEYAEVLINLGRRYNMALLAPERNNHGLAVVTHLFHAKYPNLYAEMVPDPPGKPRKRYGWVTSRTTRPLIIDNLISEIVEESHGIECKETLDEMLSFKIQDNGKMEADSGFFDDRVISIAIAKYLRQVIDLPSARKGRHDNNGRPRGVRSRRNPKGWT